MVGDVMLDRYWHGTTTRISPEAPVPVVKITTDDHRLGGAANVAVNLQALGVSVGLMGIVGVDAEADVLKRGLAQHGIEDHLVIDHECPTISKLRVISQHQQLIRIDFEESFPVAVAENVFSKFKSLVADYDVFIFSDYAKGTLSFVKEMIDIVRLAGKKSLVDPKSADYSIYFGADVITPNFHEFELVAGRCDSELKVEEMAKKIVSTFSLGALLVTRSERGMSLFRRDHDAAHIPSRALDVFDVTGAGDTVIATLGAGLACDYSLEKSVSIANAAAGIVVGKLGTATVSTSELEAAL